MDETKLVQLSMETRLPIIKSIWQPSEHAYLNKSPFVGRISSHVGEALLLAKRARQLCGVLTRIVMFT